MKNCSGIAIVRLLLATILILFAVQLSFGSALWGDLKPGVYSIGFETIEKYDYSRSIQPKKDYFGEPLEGERARPIQICIWYPAGDNSDTPEMVYGNYVFPNPKDGEFFRAVSGVQNRELQFLGMVFGGDQGRILDAISAPVAARRDAPHSDGKFPLIIYHPEGQGGMADNMVLCEFLASYGFVVATTHSIGALFQYPEKNQADLEMVVRDREFALAELRNLDYIDNGKIALIGAGFGGLAASVMQMRGFDFDALVSLGGWQLLSDHIEFARQNPFNNRLRMIVPQLQIYRNIDNAFDLSHIDSSRYSQRYLLAINDTILRPFSCYGAIRQFEMSEEVDSPNISRPDYDLACQYILNFLNSTLNNNEKANKFIDSQPTDNGFAAGLASISFKTAEEIPPTTNQFVGIIRSQGARQAQELYDKFQKLNPGSIEINEANMNMIGYRFLQSGQTEDAVIIFKMNATAFPDSPNCWDSYADGAQAAGDDAQAIACYTNVLKLLPNDSTLDDNLRQVLKDNAEAGLQNLQSGN